MPEAQRDDRDGKIGLTDTLTALAAAMRRSGVEHIMARIAT